MKKIIALLFLLPCLVKAQFTELASMPESVSNNAVVSAEVDGQKYVYSFSGIDSTKIWSGIHLKSWRYDVANDEWSGLPDVPDPNGGKIAAWASMVKGKIYLIGGYHVASNGSETSSVKTHVFDPETNTWQPDAADIPIPIDDQVQAVWRDSLIFVVTGWSNSGNVTAVQVFNPSTNEWKAATPVPSQSNFRVFGASGVIVGDTIFYAGGARFANNFPASSHFRKGVINPTNPTEIEWSGWIDADAKGYRMAALESGGKAYWFGGSDVTYNYDGIAYNGSGGVEAVDRIAVYNPEKGVVFRTEGNMPPIMDLRGQGQIADNQLIIAGGMEGEQMVTNRTWLVELGELISNDEGTKDKFEVKIFPNPSSEWVNVESTEPAELKIWNQEGRLVEHAFGVKNRQFDVRKWGQGVFSIQFLWDDGGHFSYKLLITK